MNPESNGRYVRFAWVTLALNIGVILWGAVVRATGSGAGCGSHWPLCNGVVIPATESPATTIEFVHRLSSGLAMIFVMVLIVWGWRIFPSGHPVRRSSVAAGVFVIIEALVGAGLVLFELVAGNTSMARGVVGAIHLANTFLLLGALVITAIQAGWGSGRRWRKDNSLTAWLAVSLLGLLVVGMSGAVVALGDTLFRPATLVEGLSAELAAASHPFVRLRVMHPVLALGCSALVVTFGWHARVRARQAAASSLSTALWTVVAVQLVIGVINVALLAPVPVQLVHLLLSDLSWILAVSLGLVGLTEIRPESVTVGKTDRAALTTTAGAKSIRA